jgi:hypothetical protein
LRVTRNAQLPVIDRGEGYEKMLRGECAPRFYSPPSSPGLSRRSQ